MKLFHLIKYETKKFWNGLLISLKKPQYIFGYIIFFATLFFLNNGLSLFLFEANELRQKIFNLQIFTDIELIFLVLPLWNIYSIVKGIFSRNFLKFYNTSDSQILFTSSLSVREIHLAKYLMYFLKRFIILTLFYISISPIVIFLKMTFYESIILFFCVFIFYEINFLIEFNISSE